MIPAVGVASPPTLHSIQKALILMGSIAVAAASGVLLHPGIELATAAPRGVRQARARWWEDTKAEMKLDVKRRPEKRICVAVRGALVAGTGAAHVSGE